MRTWHQNRMVHVKRDLMSVTFTRNLGAFKTLNLSKNGNLNEAAQNLFSMLHKLEKLKVRKIAVSSIPDTGLGKAINDRLKRASYSK